MAATHPYGGWRHGNHQGWQAARFPNGRKNSSSKYEVGQVAWNRSDGRLPMSERGLPGYPSN